MQPNSNTCSGMPTPAENKLCDQILWEQFRTRWYECLLELVGKYQALESIGFSAKVQGSCIDFVGKTPSDNQMVTIKISTEISKKKDYTAMSASTQLYSKARQIAETTVIQLAKEAKLAELRVSALNKLTAEEKQALGLL